MICCIVATIFSGCFLISCPNINFAGVTKPYETWLNSYSEPNEGNNSSLTLPSMYNLENPCNSHCKCNKLVYEPVSIQKITQNKSFFQMIFMLQICGSDGLLYFSPCFAGCLTEKTTNHSKFYKNCNCINNNFISEKNTEAANEKLSSDRSYEAVNKMCDSKCEYLEIFVILCFFVMFFTFLSTMPALSATLR